MKSAPYPVLLQVKLEGLAERLRMARRARSISQEDLAHLSGLGLSTVKAMERGHEGVALGSWLKVLAAMGLSDQVDDLLIPKRDPEVVHVAVEQLSRTRSSMRQTS